MVIKRKNPGSLKMAPRPLPPLRDRLIYGMFNATIGGIAVGVFASAIAFLCLPILLVILILTKIF